MEKKVEGTPTIAANLKRLRAASGMSQQKVAMELQLLGCDIGRSAYSNYEKGNHTIKTSILKNLQKVFNCTYEDFFVENEEQE